MNKARYWHIVRNRDFTRDNVGFYRVEKPRVGANVSRDFQSRAPDRQTIERSTGKPVTVIRSERSRVKTSNRNFERMNLPKTEDRKVEQNTERVKKDVLVPRSQYKKKEDEKKQQPQRERKEQPKKEDHKN